MNPAVSEAVVSQVESRSSWMNRKFILVWVATIVSLIGDSFSQIALSMWVLQTTGSALSMTIILASRAIVGGVFGPLAGGLVDRMDRRLAMLIANGARALTTFGVAYLVTNPASAVLYPVVALSAIGALFGSLHEPARAAAIVMLVGRDHLTRAGSLMQLSGMAAMIVGPVLGGIVVVSGGPYMAMLGDATTFVVAFLLVLIAGSFGNPPKSSTKSLGYWASLGQGMQFLRKNQLVGTFVLVVAPMIAFCQAAIGILFPVMAIMVWKVTGTTFGILQSMFAVGFVVAMTILSIKGDAIRRRGLFWGAGMISAGLLLGLMGTLESVWLVLPVLAGVGFTLAASNMVTQVAVQRETPPDLQGRVFGVLSSMLLVTTPVALSVVGLLSDSLGPALITSAAGLLVVAIGVGGLLLPVIRRYELAVPPK